MLGSLSEFNPFHPPVPEFSAISTNRSTKTRPLQSSCNQLGERFVVVIERLVFAVSSYMKIKRFTALVGATALLLAFCLILPGSSQAQGVDGLSQLLGGGFGLTHNSGQSSNVTVQRNAPPYTGMFSGKETSASETKSLDAKFACYPAHDPAFEQTDTFVCYAGQ
jgi:hypothetical protein